VRRLAILGSVAAVLSFAFASPVLAAPPANDQITSPTVVGALPYTDGPSDTTEATTGATDPDACFGSPDRATVWYAFAPEADGWYQADTFESGYDTTLYVGTSNGAGGINVIQCNDDFGGLQSRVNWEAVAGVGYLLAVGTCCGAGVVGGTGGGGTLVFHVNTSEPPPPPPTIELTVDAIGSFGSSGMATIRGTIACTGDAQFSELNLDLVQRVGRFTIRGFGFEFFEPCPTSPTPWSIVVIGDTGKFAGGAVQVNAYAFTCGFFECAEAQVSQQSRLRR
jgi:hypothetical protein